MKKVVALFLALVMCLSLCACGGEDKSAEYEKVRAAMVGAWLGEGQLEGSSYPVLMTYIFDEKTASGGVDISLGVGMDCIATTRAYGTYDISDGKITISWTSFDIPTEEYSVVPYTEITYTYENDTLRLFDKVGHELTYQKLW